MKSLIRPPKSHGLKALQSAKIQPADAHRLRGGTDGEFPWQVSIRP